MTAPRIALVGNGAMALEYFELFAPATFCAVFSEAAFADQNRLPLPQYTEPAVLRAVADHYVLAIGDVIERQRLSAVMEAAGLTPCPPLLLPGAVVSPSSRVDAGSVIGHGVQVGARCHIGPHNFLMHHAVVGHDTTTGSHVVLCPGSYVAGYVRIGARVVIQAHAAVARSLSVGDDALVCQGASCFRDVPAAAIAIGNPARLRRKDG